MWQQIALGTFLVLVTTFLHTVATAVALTRLKGAVRVTRGHLSRSFVISALVLGLFLVTLFDAVLWAQVYVAIGAIPDQEGALYFSMVTFTTLGYGDLTLQADWRLLASLEAANGIIMFGWSTALIVSYIQRLAPAYRTHLDD